MIMPLGRAIKLAMTINLITKETQKMFTYIKTIIATAWNKTKNFFTGVFVSVCNFFKSTVAVPTNVSINTNDNALSSFVDTMPPEQPIRRPVTTLAITPHIKNGKKIPAPFSPEMRRRSALLMAQTQDHQRTIVSMESNSIFELKTLRQQLPKNYNIEQFLKRSLTLQLHKSPVLFNPMKDDPTIPRHIAVIKREQAPVTAVAPAVESHPVREPVTTTSLPDFSAFNIVAQSAHACAYFGKQIDQSIADGSAQKVVDQLKTSFWDAIGFDEENTTPQSQRLNSFWYTGG